MLETVFLAAVQGVTEFLPISSSGHLLLLPKLFGWAESGLAFDVALNTGTFLAVLIYFAPTYKRLIIEGLWRRQANELRLVSNLIFATLPAALIGLMAAETIEERLRDPRLAAAMMVVFGLALAASERYARLSRNMSTLGWWSAILVGLAQAVALVPGVSRSGVTMTAGLLTGLTKPQAARFSFLLLAPISLGAALVELPRIIAADNTGEMVIGAAVSFAVGLAAIHFLLGFVERYGFRLFVWYRVAVGLIFLFILT